MKFHPKGLLTAAAFLAIFALAKDPKIGVVAAAAVILIEGLTFLGPFLLTRPRDGR